MNAAALALLLHLSPSIMSNDEDRSNETLLAAPETEIEPNTRETQPPSIDGAAATAINRHEALRPPKVPSSDELATTAIARRELPEWWHDSFLGQKLDEFAEHARQIKDGERTNHLELMTAIRGSAQTLQRQMMAVSSRVTGVEAGMRALKREVRDIKTAQDRDRQDFTAELREIKSIQTAFNLRVEMIEQNGTIDQNLIGKTILVVDDEELLQSMLKRMLNKRGAGVATASCWGDIADYLDDKSNPSIDFVLLDVTLGAEDGLQIAEWLIAKGIPREHILLITGRLDAEHSDIISELGVRVLAKPFVWADLAGVMSEVLVPSVPEPPR
jgi:CheY-like chemotaxis protein